MDVSFNVMRDPGNTFTSAYRHCQGASTFTLLDSRGFRIEANMIENSRGLSNAQGNSLQQPLDPNRIFSDINAPDFSDLPHSSMTVLNFVVAQRPRPDAAPSLGNEIIGNVLHATCLEMKKMSNDDAAAVLRPSPNNGTGFEL